MPHNENWPKRLRVRNDPGPKRPTKIGRNDPRPNLGRNDPGRNDPAETTQGRNVPDSGVYVLTRMRHSDVFVMEVARGPVPNL